MFTFLRAIGLSPIEWTEAIKLTGKGSPYIGEVLDVALDAAQAIVVLMTPDEIAYLRTEYASDVSELDAQAQPQARPNVLFEAGMALGRAPDRTVITELGTMRPFSDVAGRHAVRLSNAPAVRRDLAQRLQTAGCDVNLEGTDWLETTAGDFTAPPEPGGGLPLGKRVPSITSTGGPRIDVRYHDVAGKSTGRLEVINRGSQSLYDVNVELPESDERGVIQFMGSTPLPIPRLPGGKSVMLFCWVRGLAYGDVTVTCRTDDGTEVREDIFVDLNG